MISVLVVDAQPLQRFGFRMLLESTPDTEIVGEAENGTEAVRRTTELHPDVVLMDIRMPASTGSRPPGASSPPVGDRGSLC